MERREESSRISLRALRTLRSHVVFHSATYRHGASGVGRRQIVKNGNAAGWPAAGASGRIIPMVTPRSPLDATITLSGAQEIVLPPGGCPYETLRLIFSGPTTSPGSVGGPRCTASALP